MSFMSSIRTRYLAWSRSTPLPDLPDAPLPVFQQWHAFDKISCEWASLEPASLDARCRSQIPVQSSQTPNLQLLTWNTDAFTEHNEARMEGILSKLQQMCVGDGNGPDIVFFQEVSRRAFVHLLQNTWVREHWVSSEADETNWKEVPFATVTLLSRARFGVSADLRGNATESALFSPGPLWRVKFPSRFRRDALCCDIFCAQIRLRLINVHLDSLDMQPNQRPRQVAITGGLLRAAGVGRGLIAGDWNPVSKEDATLVQENGLIDAWEQLNPGEDGFTWGLDGKGAPFPPGRLDKVVMQGLDPVAIEVVHPEILSTATDSKGESMTGEGEEGVPWSDHSGLLCSFTFSDATK